MIDQSAVARVLGITTQFRDLRQGGVLFLPQRIAVFAQGESGVSFSADKWEATSAGEAGAKYGFRSAIYQVMRQLRPANGDGVGSLPITIYPLGDHGSGAAAVGDITPSGTPTAARSYRPRVAGMLGDAFTIAAGSITGAALTAACVAIGDAINATIGMPGFVTYTYGSPSASALTGTGNGTLTSLAVTGNPRPGVWTLKLTTVVANGGVWTLTDPLGTPSATPVTMTPGAGGATVIDNSGLQFTLTDGSTDFGLNATFTITVPATNVKFTAGWKGVTGNDILLEVIGDSAEVTFAFTQPTGGLNNPDIDPALAKMGGVWETMAINQFGFADTANLDKIQTFGEGRWGALVRKPLVFFSGNTKASVTTAIAVSSTRRTDRVNVQLVAPGSVNLPFVVAARQLARIAVLANNDPPHDYGSQQATGILPGADGVQWDQIMREQAVKNGCSTVEVKDSVVNVSDVVTCYRPTGEEPPGYRYVVDIVKLQNIIFNIDLAFAVPEWDGAPLVPDKQVVTRPSAKKPRMAKARVAGIIDSLGLEAIISDPEAVKKTIKANIDSQNPKRLNLEVTGAVSGNTNIKDFILNWGFFFGSAA